VTILKFISKLLVIPAIFLLSCGPKGEAGCNEGSIEFATRPMDENHPLFGLAPSSATLKYKDEKFALEMSSMGMFHTAIIGDTKAKTITQTVKFLDIKQACIETEKDIIAENKDFALKIEETNETKEIIGLKSYKLKVTMVNDPSITFDAWYTKDLGMEDCNSLNPYAQVKGVLLDYRVKKMGMEMHFVAKSRKKDVISEKTFEIPSHMQIVDKATMAKNFTN